MWSGCRTPPRWWRPGCSSACWANSSGVRGCRPDAWCRLHTRRMVSRSASSSTGSAPSRSVLSAAAARPAVTNEPGRDRPRWSPRRTSRLRTSSTPSMPPGPLSAPRRSVSASCTGRTSWRCWRPTGGGVAVRPGSSMPRAAPPASLSNASINTWNSGCRDSERSQVPAPRPAARTAAPDALQAARLPELFRPDQLPECGLLQLRSVRSTSVRWTKKPPSRRVQRR